MKRLCKTKLIVLALFLIYMIGLMASIEVSAVSTNAVMYIDAEGDGKILGTVGSEITPYHFTLTIKKGSGGTETPSFKYAYEAGRNVTGWFQGTCDPEKNVFRQLPIGLTVKTAKAIAIGDTSAEFVISGTPYMGSSGWLQIGISQSVFDGNAQHTNKVETGNGIQFGISRHDSNVSLKLSPTSLNITGTAGSAISSKELTFNLTGGNFISSYPANMDVSDWFRGSDWIINYDGEYMTAKLPTGLSVKLKKAVNIGDTSCTFVIYGTPTYGANEYMVPVFPQGSIAFAGSDRNEHGYGPQGFGCNNDYMFKISGETNKPGLELESIKVNGADAANITGTVGTALTENLLTYRLKNCTLTTTYAQGHDITGFFLKWNYPYETCAFDGMGVKVEVVDFTAGNDYFTCRITGTPKKNGHGTLTVKLFEEHTSAGVRMSSMSKNQSGFGFSTPTENATVTISSQTYDCKLGFMLDTSETPVEIEISNGHSTEYCLNGSFKKDQDVSNLVTNLPIGIKAYAAKATADMSSSIYVYFKGVPSSTGNKSIKASLGGLEYYSKPQNGSWFSTSDAAIYTSETFVTMNITSAPETAFAYSYSLDPHDEGTGAVSELSYEDLKTIADSEPINLRGNITTKQYVEVENGTAAIKSKSAYTGTGINVWLYIPQITFSKSYNELANVNDMVQLMKADENGINVTSGPLTGYNIYTETELPKGKQTGINILLYIEGIAKDATSCFDGLQLQIKDGSSWKNVTMPTGSLYEIGEVITGQVPVTLNSFNGSSASIADCVINGISYSSLMDRLGVEVSVSGGTFRYMHKGNNVTSWFTNLPSGMSAVIKEDAPAGSTTVKIRFGKLNSRTWKIGPVTPNESSTSPILVTVPFSALAEDIFSNIDGGIVAAQNQNARYNILTAESFVQSGKMMMTSVEFNGVYKKNGAIGEGSSLDYSTIYIPGNLLTGYTNAILDLSLTLVSGNEDLTFESGEFYGVGIPGLVKISGISQDIYTCKLNLYLPMISANKVSKGLFNVRAALCEYAGDEPPASETYKDLTLSEAYIGYNIKESGTILEDEDSVEEGSVNTGEQGTGNGGSTGGSGSSADPGYLIDFENKEGDIIVYAKDSSGKTVTTTYFNMTQEKLASGISYKCYSVDGGNKWKETSKFTDKQIDAMLKKGMTLSIADKYDKKAKKPADNAVVYSFDAINKRPAAPKLKAEYKTYSDPTGYTPGKWTLADKSYAALSKDELTKYEIGIAASDKKTVSSAGYSDIPIDTGMDFEMVSGKTADSTIYFVRTKATEDTPASKAAKLTVKGQGKASKIKADYKKEILKAKKGMIVFFGDTLSEDSAELKDVPKNYIDYTGKYLVVDEALAKSGIDISGYITDTRNTILIWTAATEKKASTVAQVIKLAKRDSIKAEKLSVTDGKFKLDKKYEVYDEAKSKWGGLPKISQSCEYKLRLKATAKGGAETDSNYAASSTGTLKITYDVIDANKNKSGITAAEIVIN